jgi:hypothetical protein
MILIIDAVLLFLHIFKPNQKNKTARLKRAAGLHLNIDKVKNILDCSENQLLRRSTAS